MKQIPEDLLKTARQVFEGQPAAQDAIEYLASLVAAAERPEPVTLSELKSLADIKTNGFYRVGSSAVKADCIGLPEFKTCQLPPVRVSKTPASAYQFMVDAQGVHWLRSASGGYSGWLDISEVAKYVKAMGEADAARWRYYAPRVAERLNITMDVFNSEIDQMIRERG